MYEAAFASNPQVVSDDASAMEKETKLLWEKMMVKMPDNIKKLDNGSFIYKP